MKLFFDWRKRVDSETGIHQNEVSRLLCKMKKAALILIFVLGILAPIAQHLCAEVFECPSDDVGCLIESINTSNKTGGDNTIVLEAGTYTLTAVDNVTNGPNGLPSITSQMTITGAGANETIIARDISAPLLRILHVGGSGTLTLNGLTISEGSVSSSLAGGGLFNNGGTVAGSDAAFVHNTADFGGGLANNGGTVTISNTIFTGNIADHPGGGLFNHGGTTIISNTTFTRNRADTGGGLSNHRSFPTPVENTTVTITNSTFSENRALTDGGGLANIGGIVTLSNTTFGRNLASNGGGGGIFNLAAGTVTITNTTISANSATQGGGLKNFGGPVVLLNTILALNGGGLGGPDCLSSAISLGNNVIGNPTGCSITLRSSDLTGDPRLGPFTDDGTPGRGYFPLLSDSPAIDAGNNVFCPPTDQLGQPRVDGGSGSVICDIGAIEFQPELGPGSLK